MLDAEITLDTLVKHKWKPHPLFLGLWTRDGQPYVSTRDAIAVEFAERIARERIKSRGPQNEEHCQANNERNEARYHEQEHWFENESLKRREYFEKHYVVPTVDVTAEQKDAPKRRAARDRRLEEAKPIVGKPIKWDTGT